VVVGVRVGVGVLWGGGVDHATVRRRQGLCLLVTYHQSGCVHVSMVWLLAAARGVLIAV
jgi:hypothetical protein